MADEQKLIKKAQRGDVASFEQVLSEYQTMVYGISYRFAGNTEDASDMAQEVFIKMFKNINSFKFRSKFSTWVYRVATNTCLDIRKRNKNNDMNLSLDAISYDGNGDLSGNFADTDPLPDEKAEAAEREDVINAAISRLSDEYRTMIILRDINGLSYDEISSITECSIGTVKSRLSRARKNLRKILSEDRELFENYFV